MIAAALTVFIADQVVYQHVGSAVLPQAPLDWTNHLLTTLFLVWALRSMFRERQLVAALVASVVIDVDHIPGYLGSDVLTAGTHRPYSHSLLTVAVLVALALACARWRDPLFGAAIGVSSHLWRDLAEPHGAGVALLWPLSDRTVTTPAWIYLASIAALASVGWARAVVLSGHPRPG